MFAKVSHTVCVEMFYRLFYREDSSNLMPEMISKYTVLCVALTLPLICFTSTLAVIASSVHLPKHTAKLKANKPVLIP